MVMVDESTVGKKNLPPRKLLNLGWLAGWLGWLADRQKLVGWPFSDLVFSVCLRRTWYRDYEIVIAMNFAKRRLRQAGVGRY